MACLKKKVSSSAFDTASSSTYHRAPNQDVGCVCVVARGKGIPIIRFISGNGKIITTYWLTAVQSIPIFPPALCPCVPPAYRRVSEDDQHHQQPWHPLVESEASNDLSEPAWVSSAPGTCDIFVLDNAQWFLTPLCVNSILPCPPMRLLLTLLARRRSAATVNFPMLDVSRPHPPISHPSGYAP